MHPRDLEGLSRSDLIEKAEALGVDKASLLTRTELADEIVRRTIADPIERRIARGLLGVARDLVARVVERGLHLPEAAAMIRGTERPSWIPAKSPIATVTLAEIYAAQGHRARALSVLDEVLESEADHAAARDLRDEIAATPADEPILVPEPDERPAEVEETSPVDATSMAAAWPVETQSEEGSGPGVPAGMLDDAPLPEKYDVDEVVLMPVDPKTVFVYWEVRQRSSDESRARAPDGRLIVRIVAVTANWQGPVVETRDIEAPGLVGDWFVRDLPVGAVLRAAIGWSAATGFAPLSVAMDLTAPPAGPAAVGARELARFAPEGIIPLEGSHENDAVALAVERARRRVARESSDPKSSSSWPSIAASPASDFPGSSPTEGAAIGTTASL
jgi:hypothetical protein